MGEWYNNQSKANLAAHIVSQEATIARLTAELEAARDKIGDWIVRADEAHARAEAAEALLGAAYRAALTDARRNVLGWAASDYSEECSTMAYAIADDIRALPLPADLAARLGGAK